MMLRSMTGFGRAKALIGDLDITVEVKSVNHRYFEFACRVPRAYLFLEEKLKGLAQKKISRGKVEISVFIEDNSASALELQLNEEYVGALLKAVKCLSKQYRIKNDIKASDIASNPDAFKTKRNTRPDEEISEAVLSVAEEALKSFVSMRETEGKRLRADVLEKTEFILERVAIIEKSSPERVMAYRQRLEEKMRELLGDVKVEEQRLITETAIFADKIAVDEETVRLKSHIKQLKVLMENDGPIGKKLDFIIQEMNRETNTIGSKSQDAEIAHIVVDMKSEIEKIREQIQNIE